MQIRSSNPLSPMNEKYFWPLRQLLAWIYFELVNYFQDLLQYIPYSYLKFDFNLDLYINHHMKIYSVTLIFVIETDRLNLIITYLKHSLYYWNMIPGKKTLWSGNYRIRRLMKLLLNVSLLFVNSFEFSVGCHEDSFSHITKKVQLSFKTSTRYHWTYFILCPFKAVQWHLL